MDVLNNLVGIGPNLPQKHAFFHEAWAKILNSKNSNEIPPTKRTTVKDFIHEEMKCKNFKHKPLDNLKISVASPSN